MKLQHVQLKNIGQFSNLDIHFSLPESKNPATVILGHQNSGKTTILKQIFQGLSWFANRHKDPRSAGIAMVDVDIKHEATNASMLMKVNYPSELGHVVSDTQAKPRTDYTCTWKLQKMRQTAGTLNISTSELSELETLVSLYHKQVIADPLFSTPCIAYYPVERFIYEVNIQGKNALSTLTPLHNAYDLTSVNFTTFNKFFEWYREIHDLENAQAAKLFKEYLDPTTRFSQQDDFNDAISAMEQAYRLSTQRSINSLNFALKTVIPEVEKVELEYSPKLAMLVKHQGEFTPFLQLPQSTRIWIGLVGDLVRRLCLLNPNSLYPCLEGEGIVLIDSIDLLLDTPHLQQIIARLKRAFPRIQFVVSTQSTEILENTEDLNCLQLSHGSIQALNFEEHQHKLAEIYQELTSPISEKHEQEEDKSSLLSANLNSTEILGMIQTLEREEQKKLLDQLQQHLEIKDS